MSSRLTTTTASLACGVPRPADSAAPATQESELWEPGKRLQLSLRLGSEGGASRLSQSTGREHSAPRMVRAVRCKGEHRLVSSFSHSIPSRFGCAVELRWAEARSKWLPLPFRAKIHAHLHTYCTQGDCMLSGKTRTTVMITLGDCCK